MLISKSLSSRKLKSRGICGKTTTNSVLVQAEMVEAISVLLPHLTLLVLGVVHDVAHELGGKVGVQTEFRVHGLECSERVAHKVVVLNVHEHAALAFEFFPVS